jgi:hypothetical protein
MVQRADDIRLPTGRHSFHLFYNLLCYYALHKNQFGRFYQTTKNSKCQRRVALQKTILTNCFLDDLSVSPIEKPKGLIYEPRTLLRVDRNVGRLHRRWIILEH